MDSFLCLPFRREILALTAYLWMALRNRFLALPVNNMPDVPAVT